MRPIIVAEAALQTIGAVAETHAEARAKYAAAKLTTTGVVVKTQAEAEA
jgi:hypothetical protein